jgi:hypothetical protein
MVWKTVSVEAGDGFSKLVLSERCSTEHGSIECGAALQEGGSMDRSGFDSGMQKDGLTMFPLRCYSC